MYIDVNEWLQMPCLEEDVKGSPHEGFYLGIDTVKKKIRFMEAQFKMNFHYSNFNHSLFNSSDKRIFATGSMQIEIYAFYKGMPNDVVLFKRLVGAYTFNTADYDNERDRNEQFAGTLKSLCTLNALMGEYPQFGSLLNNHELVRTIQGNRPGKTSEAVKKSLNRLS